MELIEAAWIVGSGAATAIGSISLLFFTKPSELLLDALLGFTSGVMLASKFFQFAGPGCGARSTATPHPGALRSCCRLSRSTTSRKAWRWASPSPLEVWSWYPDRARPRDPEQRLRHERTTGDDDDGVLQIGQLPIPFRPCSLAAIAAAKTPRDVRPRSSQHRRESRERAPDRSASLLFAGSRGRGWR